MDRTPERQPIDPETLASAYDEMRALARRRGAKKRGGDWERVNWESAVTAAEEYPGYLLTLDAALSRLSGQAPDHAKIVESMFFAGLTGEETARAPDVSASNVDRKWRFARAWLHRELTGD